MSKKMFPAALILEGRKCLLVGGGRVAVRKAAKLAEAGAALTVVAPEIKPPIKALSGINLVERCFVPEDLDGAFLVFALTDNPVLNRRIVELCREKKILCSAADGNWPDGDLILPASFSEDGLTVSVSTSGRSCRRSRLLRESLSRHVRFLRDIDLIVIGADHSTGGFQSVEKLKAARTELEELLPCVWGVHEFMILDTCNRFEIVALISSGSCAAVETVLRKTSDVFVSRGMDAFCRLAETAAGLRSQAFGESRIVAQIKQSLADAQEKGFAGSFLQNWTDTALHISKEIRQVTGSLLPALETEDLVSQTLKRNLPAVGKVLIIGRGEIGQGLARRFPDAVQISGRSDDELRQQLPRADVIICATGSAGFLIDESHRPLLRAGAVLIDLSLPRNINPELPGVIGLSALRAAVPPGNADELFAKAREIINAHRDEYDRLVKFQ
ncbi:MAG: hypothetical protein HOO88_02095 [Kiritimatiellaceae bacterium]|nr:hypothetical protein [Kiritimatiellaceae bacterium]